MPMSWVLRQGISSSNRWRTNSPQEPGKILDVQLLGYQDKLRWKQDKQGLQVRMPAANMSDIGVTFKVTLA